MVLRELVVLHSGRSSKTLPCQSLSVKYVRMEWQCVLIDTWDHKRCAASPAMCCCFGVDSCDVICDTVCTSTLCSKEGRKWRDKHYNRLRDTQQPSEGPACLRTLRLLQSTSEGFQTLTRATLRRSIIEGEGSFILTRFSSDAAMMSSPVLG